MIHIWKWRYDAYCYLNKVKLKNNKTKPETVSPHIKILILIAFHISMYKCYYINIYLIRSEVTVENHNLI